MNMKTGSGQAVGQVVFYLPDVGHVAVLPVQEAARRLGYTRRYTQLLCAMDKLVAIKFCNRWWVLERSVNQFVKTIDNAPGTSA